MDGDISLQLPAGQLAPSEALRAKHEAARDDFAEAVLSGLARERRSIPCRFFYDAVGSARKTIKIFSAEEGGAEHAHVDNRQVGIDFAADWLAEIPL